MRGSEQRLLYSYEKASSFVAQMTATWPVRLTIASAQNNDLQRLQ